MILGKNHRKARESESGLTLIEISIGMVLLGLFVGWATQAYLYWKVERTYETLNNNIVAINQSIGEFYLTNNRYPCPADITFSINNPSYGEEIPSVARNICGQTAAAISTNGGVVTGGVPFKVLNIAEEITLDPWANKISYTVTAVQAIDATHPVRQAPTAAELVFLPEAGSGTLLPRGRITMAVSRLLDTDADTFTDTVVEPTNIAVDEGDLNADGFSDATGLGIGDTNMIDTSPTDGFDDISGGPMTNNVGIHYVLNSHGPEGIGATTRVGNIVQACPAIGTSREAHNCNGDNLFWRGRRGNDASIGDSVFSDVAGANYFDDVNLLRDELPDSMFQYARTTSGSGSGATTQIFSNEDFVGINPPRDVFGNISLEPAANLHVMGATGTLLLERDPALPINDSKGAAIAPRICDLAGNCFDPAFFTTRTVECQGPPPGEGTGLYREALFCNFDYNPGLDVDCAPTGILRGVDAAGDPICN